MDIQTSPDPFVRARDLGAEILTAADEIEHTRCVPGALLERLHASRPGDRVDARSLVGEVCHLGGRRRDNLCDAVAEWRRTA